MGPLQAELRRIGRSLANLEGQFPDGWRQELVCDFVEELTRDYVLTTGEFVFRPRAENGNGNRARGARVRVVRDKGNAPGDGNRRRAANGNRRRAAIGNKGRRAARGNRGRAAASGNRGRTAANGNRGRAAGRSRSRSPGSVPVGRSRSRSPRVDDRPDHEIQFSSVYMPLITQALRPGDRVAGNACRVFEQVDADAINNVVATIRESIDATRANLSPDDNAFIDQLIGGRLRHLPAEVQEAIIEPAEQLIQPIQRHLYHRLRQPQRAY